MSKPLVSIIMPVYNRASLIKATLETIRVQTYNHWECVIIDDGSTDTTEAIITSFVDIDTRFQYHKRPEHIAKGANSCRNYGFTLAKGEFINWFDSDDIMMPNFISEKTEAFKVDTDAVLHRNNYGNYELYDFRDSKFDYNKKQLYYHYAMETIEIQTCGFMWRKSYLEDKELFDETIDRYQDNEFHIRLLAQQPKVEIIETVLATIRSGNSHEGQISDKKSVTKKKLYDIFYCRYQSLKYGEVFGLNDDKVFVNAISKKILWAFYGGLSFEKSPFKRAVDVVNYFGMLKTVYLNKNYNFLSKLKSILYIFKVVLFR